MCNFLLYVAYGYDSLVLDRKRGGHHTSTNNVPISLCKSRAKVFTTTVSLKQSPGGYFEICLPYNS